MKILDKEERDAHAQYILAEGTKGLFYGSVLSASILSFLRFRRPARFAAFNTSIKAGIAIMPTITVAAFFADQGSLEFDRKMYSEDFTRRKMLEEHRKWQQLSVSEKVLGTLSSNKYKIIFSAWVALMWGLWKFVNRDKIMTGPQKLVQARMYAQAITILLLLGTIVLAVKEEEIRAKQPAPVPEWRRILIEQKLDSEDKSGEETETS